LIIKFNFSITIPDRLIWPFVALVLFYRRIHYGYPFRRIPLTQGKYAIVDPEDYERLNKHKWYVQRTKQMFYALRRAKGHERAKGQIVWMHRDILPPPEGMCIDHIKNNSLDNRKQTCASQLRHRTQETEEKWLSKPLQSTKASLTTQARENGAQPFESTANTNISAFFKTKSMPQKLMMRQLVNSTENSHHLILNVKFEILNLRCEILAAKSRSLSGPDGMMRQGSITENLRY